MVRLLRSPRSVLTASRFLRSRCKTRLVVCSQNLHHSVARCHWHDTCEFDAFQSGHCSGTMSDVSKNIRKQIGLEPGYYTIPKCRANLLKYTPKREDLPSRSMTESFTTAILPLSSSSYRERYVNHLRRVRMGRLMEELDLFAVWICHRHTSVPTLPKGIPLPYIFVTVLVESVEFSNSNKISASEDISLCGHVSWTGMTSMEITIYMQQNFRTILKAIFVVVARNATNTAAAPINPLAPANEKEKACYDESVKRSEARQQKHSKNALYIRPTKEDEKLMFEIFKRTQGTNANDMYNLELPANCRWMSESNQTTLLRAFPDNRNLHNHIFGGFVMRTAVEISSITACLYAGGRPLIECISDVAFYSPLKVNSFIKLTAYVVYTYKKYIQLLTIVEVLQENSSSHLTTNALFLIYKAERNVQEVLPITYEESLCYINGRKKFRAFQKLRQDRLTNLKQFQKTEKSGS
ncbi:PREDICTED: acyl-coenzyme A thioesterase 9, mitochondrial [Drosophila arizonae]|uniref:Acyl-coenzyme A thioesterase 9, mitochondrial n=1 Tax=Drosophila arizonae TaxID=7263 RepID=A0ABM1NXH3_DROAR|nr:PREDICTED: acyl-coenzyme A thioesterase 9, mitochondrial [Drosophila arizonae]